MIHKIAYGLFLAAVFLSGAAAAPVCNERIGFTAPSSRFFSFSEATMLDDRTGLIWARCPLGSTFVENSDLVQDDECELGDSMRMTWQEALQAVDALNASGGYLGYTDWRLPNPKELLSLVEVRCAYPAINAAIFPNTPPSAFWSSSANPRADNGTIATLEFGQGALGIAHLSATAYVRLVRGPVL